MTEYCGLPLTVKPHPRAKRVLVKIIPNRGLEVVVPKQFDTSLVPSILNEKKRWIERTRDRLTADGISLNASHDLPENIHYAASEQRYTVHYLDRPGRVTVTANGPRLIVRGPLDDETPLIDGLVRFTVRKAREFILPKLDATSRKLGLAYSALRVRRQKTRWGSCSSRGTISVNAKLLFLPEKLVDQLILHELCHTKHMNHSPRYWALVAKHEPDFQRLERELAHGGRHVPGWFLP